VIILPWRLLDAYQTWLLSYSGLLGAVGGVLVCDYLVIRRLKLQLDDLYRMKRCLQLPEWIQSKGDARAPRRYRRRAGGTVRALACLSLSRRLVHREHLIVHRVLHPHAQGGLMRIFDLSQPLNQEVSFWPYYPPFEVKYIKRKSEHGVNAQYIQTSNHMGTHLDAPRHFVTAGRTIDEIPVEWLCGPGAIVDLRDQMGDLGVYTPK
jgi:hypothetical protein